MRLALLPLVALAACSQEHAATAPLPGEASATMRVRAMASLQSDWHRTVEVSDGRSTAQLDLFPDTGWWRGSNLYRHASGVYVLHEGQTGCLTFTLDPPVIEDRGHPACAKGAPSGAAPSGAALSSAETDPHGYPASRYHVGLFYVGQFMESGGAVAVVFLPHGERPEPELPDSL